jgi:hypothetical protein
MDDLPDRGPTLSIRLFGPFEARLDDVPIEGLRLRKADRMLAYLALHHGQWVEKERLATALWYGEAVYDPKQNLRQTLLYIRSRLPGEMPGMESRSGEMRLNLEAATLDLQQFESACRAGTHRSLEEALALAESPLLENWDDTWITPYREKYAEKVRLLQMRYQALERTRVVLPTWVSGELEKNLKDGTEIGSTQPAIPVGGAVPLDSPFYLARTSDQQFFSAIAHRESIILIKGARQTGKSSLLARGLQFARHSGLTVFEANCDLLAPEDIATLDTFYLRLASLLAEQSGQEFSPERDWKAHLGANSNLERFLRRNILGIDHTPILWALDGADKLFKTSFYATFFALLRGLHTKRATEPHGPWERFSIAITTATEAHLYIPDLDQSPFNVGTRIALDDFTEEEGEELYRRYNRTLPSREEWIQLRQLLGGHPYLLTRGIFEFLSRSLTVDAFAQHALKPNGPFHDHLEGIRRLLIADDGLCEAMRHVLQGTACPDPEFFRLRTAGLLVGDSGENAQPRCGLYGQYLARNLA